MKIMDMGVTMAKENKKKEKIKMEEETLKDNEKANVQEQDNVEEDATQGLLKQAEQQRDEYLDALLRERANFENFKRRNEQAVAKARVDERMNTASRFFPVLDNLERALTAAEENSSLKEGIEKVYKQLVGIFTEMGIEEIEAEGIAFNPNLHNAIMQVEPEGEEKSGTVRTVLQKGYRTKEQVLRHSLVVVVK